jgi:hypothetical protein
MARPLLNSWGARPKAALPDSRACAHGGREARERRDRSGARTRLRKRERAAHAPRVDCCFDRRCLRPSERQLAILRSLPSVQTETPDPSAVTLLAQRKQDVRSVVRGRASAAGR